MLNYKNVLKMHVGNSIKLSMLLALAMSFQTNASAADWLMLQGTQPETVAPAGVVVPYRSLIPKVWGFLQVNYKQDLGTVAVNSAGKNQTPFSLLQPDLNDQSGFNVFRARLAARGMADDENMVDYFVMTDFGNNGIGNPNGKKEVGTYLSDASITLKYIPGAKIRAGMFKTPGSEEGLTSVYYTPYLEFTNFTDAQILERTIKKVGAAETNGAAGGATTTHYTGVASDAVGAFRDVGLEVFDTLPIAQDWTFSYAYMVGNGSGVSLSQSSDQQTHYGYLALEKNFGGGNGYFTNAMKFYVWGQNGKRTLLSDIDGTGAGTTYAEKKYDRNRYGVGVSYYNHGLRVEGEYEKAEGMIFTGAIDSNADPVLEDWGLQYATDKSNKANGGYLNLQYEIVPQKFELLARYDWMNRLTNDVKGERDFQTTTVGFSYRFKESTRLDFNYMFRDAKAPGNAAAQTVLDNMGDRFGIQLTAGF